MTSNEKINPLEKIFTPRFDITAYPPAVIRILIGVLIVLVCARRRDLMPFLDFGEHSALSMFFGIFACLGAAQIISGVGEMFCVKLNRRMELLNQAMKEDVRNMKTKHFSVDEVADMIISDKAVDVEIIHNDCLILVGAHFEPIPSKFSKRRIDLQKTKYSIQDQSFSTAEEFRAALSAYAAGGQLAVYTIDEEEVIPQ